MTPEEWELRNMGENELKRRVLAIAHANGWAVFHMAMSPQSRPQLGARGYPDLTCARDGEVLWIELKRQTEDPEYDQHGWSVAIGRAFHLVRPSDLESGRVEELLR